MMHSIPNKDYWTVLIIDSLTGNLSGESKKELDAWIAASEENCLYYEEMKQTWDSLRILESGKIFDKEEAYRLFRKRTRSKQRFLGRSLRYAAILLPFAFLCYFAYSYFTPREKERVLISDIVVPKGSRTQLTLEDGTKIWLNAGTSLSFDPKFGKKERRIRLIGEAYLEVARNKSLPFIVDAGAVSVRVLGTKFNVNAYSDNESIKVALMEGSVQLSANASPSIFLKPNDIALYNPATGKMTVDNNIDGATDWLQNRIVFNGETFEEIIQVLERNFNVEVTINSQSIRKRHFIGDFKNNETIEQVFNVMASDGKFKYRINGNKIDVY